jgi:hypothetical protein
MLKRIRLKLRRAVAKAGRQGAVRMTQCDPLVLILPLVPRCNRAEAANHMHSDRYIEFGGERLTAGVI